MRGGDNLELVHLGRVGFVDNRGEGALSHHAPLMLLLHLLGYQLQLQLLLLLSLFDSVIEAEASGIFCFCFDLR